MVEMENIDYPESINTIQQLQFEIMRRVGFNLFDGEEVVKELIENRELWDGVIVYGEPLMMLRDVEEDFLLIDGVLIKTREVHVDKLKALGEKLRADEINVLPQEEICGVYDELNDKDVYIVKLWWE